MNISYVYFLEGPKFVVRGSLGPADLCTRLHQHVQVNLQRRPSTTGGCSPPRMLTQHFFSTIIILLRVCLQ